MYVEQLRNPDEFLRAVEKHRRPVLVHERAVSVYEEGPAGLVREPALERHYRMTIHDDLHDRDMQLIYSEFLVAKGDDFPYETSILNELYRRHADVDPVNRITGPAAAA